MLVTLQRPQGRGYSRIEVEMLSLVKSGLFPYLTESFDRLFLTEEELANLGSRSFYRIRDHTRHRALNRRYKEVLTRSVICTISKTTDSILISISFNGHSKSSVFSSVSYGSSSQKAVFGNHIFLLCYQ